MHAKKKKTQAAGEIARRMWRYKGFYLMFVPVLVMIVLFHYLPMVGIRYAFFDYNGIKEPLFVGLDHFRRMFSMSGFWNALWNTLYLSIFKLVLNTFFAVVLSVLMNELINLKFKKAVQTVIYLPHFMSWVVTASVFTLILSPTLSGLVNQLLIRLGVIEEAIYFLGSKKWWRFWYFLINVWKDTGWGTIIFMATLSGINPELYEAAAVDGAGRLAKMRYVTLPALGNTIVTVLILNLAKVMNLFESVFVLQNDSVIYTSDVLQTYIYRQTFHSGAIPDYGYTTAVGLFSSLIACALVLICNALSHRLRGRGIV